MASDGLLPGHETAAVGFVRGNNPHIDKSEDAPAYRQALRLPLSLSGNPNTGNSVHAVGQVETGLMNVGRDNRHIDKSEDAPACRRALRLPLSLSCNADTGNSLRCEERQDETEQRLAFARSADNSSFVNVLQHQEVLAERHVALAAFPT